MMKTSIQHPIATLNVTRNQTSEVVRCAECQKQVPLERAVKSETEAYRRYFCGLACLDPWEKRQRVRWSGD